MVDGFAWSVNKLELSFEQEDYILEGGLERWRKQK
jgi:hypothetical protein